MTIIIRETRDAITLLRGNQPRFPYPDHPRLRELDQAPIQNTYSSKYLFFSLFFWSCDVTSAGLTGSREWDSIARFRHIYFHSFFLFSPLFKTHHFRRHLSANYKKTYFVTTHADFINLFCGSHDPSTAKLSPKVCLKTLFDLSAEDEGRKEEKEREREKSTVRFLTNTGATREVAIVYFVYRSGTISTHTNTHIRI